MNEEYGPGQDLQKDSTGTVAWWVEFHQAVKAANHEAMLVGEVWTDRERIGHYHVRGHGLDRCIDFSFGAAVREALNTGSGASFVEAAMTRHGYAAPPPEESQLTARPRARRAGRRISSQWSTVRRPPERGPSGRGRTRPPLIGCADMRASRLGIILLGAAVAVVSPTRASGQAEPVKVLFDSDMGSDCDDAGALALLHSYADEGRAEIIGCVYSSGRVPYGAAIIEAINVYYGRPDIPVGAAHDDDVGDTVDKMTAEKLARDRAAFGHRIVDNRDAPEQTRLCRRLLAEQPDRSVTYLTVGHTKGLHDLLASEPDDVSPLDGVALVERKVRRWVAMGAQEAANEERHWRADWNLYRNGTAPFTDVLLDRFPRPVVFVATGADVLTGRSLAHTPPGNIVRTVYRDWLWNYEQKTLEDQRPSWDLIAAFFTVEGRGPFLVDVGDGHLDFEPEKGYRWEPGAGPGDHTLLVQKPGGQEELAAYLNERIARTPALRPEH